MKRSESNFCVQSIGADGKKQRMPFQHQKNCLRQRIVFLPRRRTDKPAFIVELKWDKTAEGAIRQIKDRKYMESLKDYEGDLLLVGINYDKKTKKHQCVIEASVK